MKFEVTTKLRFNSLEVFINDLSHIRITKLEDLVAIHTTSDHKKRWIIEFLFRGGAKLETQYDDFEKFKKINEALTAIELD